VAENKTFYRIEAGQQQYLGLDGTYRDLKRPDGVIMLADIKLRSQPSEKNGSASLWDIGDGILCLEFHTKMNALGPGVLSMIRKAIEIIPGRYKGLVIYNESTNFSVGANIALLWILSLLRLSPLVGWVVGQGQQTYKQLKFSPFPVVAAPSGMALGGGCEILMHSDAVQANAETYTGLVEVGVGIIPGWGGCKELLTRWWVHSKRAKGPMPVVGKVFETASLAKIAKSAFEARDYLFLRDSDGISMNRYRLLADAKAKALDLVDGYTPPEPIEISLPGPSARVGLEMVVDGFRKRGLATAHDVNVSGALAIVLSGGDTDLKDTVTEDDLLALEKRELVRLTRFPETIARVRHMLKTGRPLRN
jgi:3-hydroxyacyl-CoA dehydrogenase